MRQQREGKNHQSYKKYIHMITQIHAFLWGPLYLISEPCESPFLAFLYIGQKLAFKKT